jgi:hypothetical protein
MREGENVMNAISIQTTVLPGGKIEITSADLPPGKQVLVTVILTDEMQSSPHAIDWSTASAEEIIADLRTARVEREEEIDL